MKEMARHCESPRMYRPAQGLGLSLVEMDKAIRGSEDFGVLPMHTKGAMFYAGNGETSPFSTRRRMISRTICRLLW